MAYYKTYQKAKQNGVCPNHLEMHVVPPHVYCDECRSGMRAYGTAYRLNHMSPQQRLAYEVYAARNRVALSSDSEPAAHSTAQLACCGRWHEVSSIPFTTPCCGREWLKGNTS